MPIIFTIDIVRLDTVMQQKPDLDVQDALTSMYTVEPHTRTSSLVGGSLLVLGFGVIFPIIVLISGWQQAAPDLLGTGVVATFSVAIAISTIWSLRRWLQQTSLELNNHGLIYRTPGLTIQTSWSNVERINVCSGKAELILRTPATSSMSFGKRFLKETMSASQNIDRRVPLSLFSPWVRQSQLFQDIVRFQPHLVHEPKIIESRGKPF